MNTQTAAKQTNTEDLNIKLAKVEEEIRSYPSPITGCDAQFNYLLEQRSLLLAELAKNRLEI